MRKILFLSAMLLSRMLAHAVDYPYMTFVTADGTKISMSISSLNMTSSSGILTVTNSSTEETFTLTELTKMYFSATDETNTTTTKKACGLAFSTETATAKMGESFTEPTLTNPYSVEVTWSSSDESVATVDGSGNVTLVAAGTMVITASFAGNDDYKAGSASYTLTVEKADVVDCELAFSTETATAKMGESFTEPTLTNPYSVEVTWSSSDESVATVDGSGNVTLVAAGSAVITASFDGNDDYKAGTASYTLTVEESSTGIGGIDAEQTEVEVYSLSGMLMGKYTSAQEARSNLNTGYYIFIEGSRKYKIYIK